MKVAFFIGALNQGGYESLILDVCHHNDIAPFEIICIYRNEGNYSEAFHNTDINMYRLECHNIFSYLWQVRKFILQERINIVHAQTPSNAIISILALLFTDIHIITSLHGFSFSKANMFYRKIVYNNSFLLPCVSEYQKKYYEKRWHLAKRNKLKVVYNGVDFSKIDSAQPSLDFHSQTERIRLVMVGNFVSGRSQSVIVRSIRTLKERGETDFDFYFVGRRVDNEPARYDDCVRFCKEHKLTNVHFLGGREDVPSILKAMDGFVYSTEHDTFGIAVVEAMAAGLPVIVNDWEVMREITNDGAWATLYRSNDAEDCAGKMAALIDDLRKHPDKVHLRCEKIAKEVRAKFSIENHIRQLEQIYNSIKR